MMRRWRSTGWGEAVQDDDDPLYRAALAVEQDARLVAEMAEWEVATVADGLDAAW